MFILLRNIDKNESIYVYTRNYSIELERLLIEIYYRELVEELIDYSSEVKLEDLNTYSIEEWLAKVDEKSVNEKGLIALDRIKELI